MAWLILVWLGADLVAIYGVCALSGSSWVALVIWWNADLVAIYSVCALLGYSRVPGKVVDPGFSLSGSGL